MRPDQEDDLVFYSNGRGGVALSIDGGEYLYIKNGRRLLAEDTVWEEIDDPDMEELRGRLSEEQDEILSDFISRPPLSDKEEIVREYRNQRREERHLFARPHRRPMRRVEGLPENSLVINSSFD